MTKEMICGESIDIYYDDKVTTLNLELAKDNFCPLIVFQDWSTKNKSKDLFTLHIQEAIRLKSIIDCLIVDYYEQLADKDSIFNKVKRK